MYITKKKRKQYLIRGIVLTIVLSLIIAASIFAYVQVTKFKIPDHYFIFSGNQEGQISLRNNEGEIIDELSLKSSSKSEASDSSLTTFFYLYDINDDGGYVWENQGSNLFSVNFEKGKLEVEKECVLPGLQVSDFVTAKNTLYFKSADELALFSFDGKSLNEVFSGAFIEAFYADKDSNDLYFAAGDTLYKFSDGNLTSVYLGDRTESILKAGNYIYVANDFGSQSGSCIVHKFTKKLYSKGFAELPYSQISLASNGKDVFAVQAISNFDKDTTRISKIEKDLSYTEKISLESLFSDFFIRNDIAYGTDGTILKTVLGEKVKGVLETGGAYNKLIKID